MVVNEKSEFQKIGEFIGKLVSKKNKAYGDSFNQSHKVLEVLYPDGIRVDQYQDMMSITRIIDKLFRIANNKESFGENPYQDITGYGILGVARGPKSEDYVKGDAGIPIHFESPSTPKTVKEKYRYSEVNEEDICLGCQDKYETEDQ